MAGSLGTAGKVVMMEAIESSVTGISLLTSGASTIASASISSTDLEVSVGGTLSNNNAIDFTIEAGDVGETATQVALTNASGVLIYAPLGSSVLLQTAGTATISADAFEASL